MACPGFVDTPMIREAQAAAVRRPARPPHMPSCGTCTACCLSPASPLRAAPALLHARPLLFSFMLLSLLHRGQTEKVKALKASFVPNMMTAAQARRASEPLRWHHASAHTHACLQGASLRQTGRRGHLQRLHDAICCAAWCTRSWPGCGAQVAKYTVRGLARGGYLIGSPDRGGNLIVGSRSLPCPTLPYPHQLARKGRQT